MILTLPLRSQSDASTTTSQPNVQQTVESSNSSTSSNLRISEHSGKSLSSRTLSVTDLTSKKSNISPKSSPRLETVENYIKSLHHKDSQEDSPEKKIQQFYDAAMQLSHSTQSLKMQELRPFVAQLFTHLDLKNPNTFASFQDDQPTWKKAYTIYEYLKNYQIFQSIPPQDELRINNSIKSIKFIHAIHTKATTTLEAEMTQLHLFTESSFQNFLSQTLDFITGWEEEDLKSKIELYLIENEIRAENYDYYLSLAKTYHLSLLKQALKNMHASNSDEKSTLLSRISNQ